MKTSIVTPILKSSNPPTTCNYRPISILSAESEKAEKCTFNLNNSTFSLHPKLFRFRVKHSTEIANCFFIESVKALLDGVVLLELFLELRIRLIFKLSTFNFTPDPLTDLKLSVDNYQSNALSFSTAVLRGTILGTFLLSLHINDLPVVCPTTETQVYADDTVYVHSNAKSQVGSI